MRVNKDKINTARVKLEVILQVKAVLYVSQTEDKWHCEFGVR